MLNQIRGGMKSIIAKIITGLLVASFALWGIPNLFLSSGNNVADIGKTSISLQEFDVEFSRYLGRLMQISETPPTRAEARAQGMDRALLNQLITTKALNAEAKRLGMMASDSMLYENVHSTEAFKNPVTSDFDKNVYRTAVANVGFSISSYEQRVREEMTRSMVTDSLSTTFRAPSVLLDTIFKRQAETRSVDFVVLNKENAGEVPVPQDEELQAFHEQKAELFTLPEYRKIQILLLQPSDFRGSVEVNEEDLLAEYNFRIDDYQTPERRTVRLLTYNDEISAGASTERLRNGEAFSVLAAEKGVSLESATRTDARKSDLIDPATAEAAFALESTGITDPVQTDFGWTVIQVQTIAPGTSRPFETVREELLELRLNDVAADKVYDLTELLENQRDEGATWAEASTTVNIPIRTIEAVDREGKDRAGNIIEDLPPLVLSEAFTLDLGEETDQFETINDNSYFAVAVDEIMDAELEPFEEVRPRVETAWKFDWHKKRYSDLADELRGKVSDGVTLFDAAVEMGLTAQSMTLSRKEEGENFSPSQIMQVFSVAIGEVTRSTARSSDAVVLTQVRDITIPNTVPVGATANLASYLGRSMSEELLNAYILAVRDDLGVTISESNLAKLFPDEGF